MHNYELTFCLEYDDDFSAGRGGKFSRIIAAESEEFAQNIAHAMLGETIGYCLWLAKVHSIQKTDQPPSVISLLENHEVWSRVVRKMKLSPASIRLIYSYRIGLKTNRLHSLLPNEQAGSPEIVGFQLHQSTEQQTQSADAYDPWKYYR